MKKPLSPRSAKKVDVVIGRRIREARIAKKMSPKLTSAKQWACPFSRSKNTRRPRTGSAPAHSLRSVSSSIIRSRRFLNQRKPNSPASPRCVLQQSLCSAFQEQARLLEVGRACPDIFSISPDKSPLTIFWATNAPVTTRLRITAASSKDRDREAHYDTQRELYPGGEQGRR